jgi:predicted DNA-binding WGR domain protein
MIILQHSDPQKCIYRWYSIRVQPTLFDRWSVVCSWGGLRSNFQQQRAIPCESEDAAGRLALQIVVGKQKRGYKIHNPDLIAIFGDSKNTCGQSQQAGARIFQNSAII